MMSHMFTYEASQISRTTESGCQRNHKHLMQFHSIPPKSQSGAGSLRQECLVRTFSKMTLDLLWQWQKNAMWRCWNISSPRTLTKFALKHFSSKTEPHRTQQTSLWIGWGNVFLKDWPLPNRIFLSLHDHRTWTHLTSFFGDTWRMKFGNQVQQPWKTSKRRFGNSVHPLMMMFCTAWLKTSILELSAVLMPMVAFLNKI